MSKQKEPLFVVDVFADDPSVPAPDWIAGFDPATDVVQSPADLAHEHSAHTVEDLMAGKLDRGTADDIDAFLKANQVF